MMHIVILVVWLTRCFSFSSSIESVSSNDVFSTNHRPIIGILSQEIDKTQIDLPNAKSIITAGYVKYLEAAGARVVPIWINQTSSYYEEVLANINGVLFPGGSANLTDKYGYSEAGRHIYSIAKEMNAKGDYFPIWGTCLGFELLAYLSSNGTNPLVTCSSWNRKLKLEFLSDYRSSRLYGSAPKDVLDVLKWKPVTVNFHHFCLTQENLIKYMGGDDWQGLSVNQDANGLTFVSSLESRKLPIFATQFHPEKNQFEWSPKQKTDHSFDAVRIAQYFANFFVNEARKSSHKFPTLEKEQQSLIYNFAPVYTGILNAMDEQTYIFK